MASFSVFKMFSRSLKEMRSVSCISVTAMLIALNLAIKLLTITISASFAQIKISFSFLSLASIGMLYGPVVGGIAGFITDILGFFVTNRSYAAFDFRFTLVEVTAGFLYGLFLYGVKPGRFFAKTKVDGTGIAVKPTFLQRFKADGWFLPRVIFAKVFVVFICNIMMTSYFIYTSVSRSDSFWVWNTPRIAKNLIQLPVDVLLLLLFLPIIYLAFSKIITKGKQDLTEASQKGNESVRVTRVLLLCSAICTVLTGFLLTYSIQLSNDYNATTQKQNQTIEELQDKVSTLEDALIKNGFLSEPDQEATQ